VDAVAADNPDLIEVHPECAFRAMAPDTQFHPKSSARGVIQRMAALATWLPDVDALLADAPPRVPIEDALDALAALWSAQRWRARTAQTLPADATDRPFIAF
jgi:predicted RNase H-like nuclease